MIGPYCRSKLKGEQEAFRLADAGAPVIVVCPTLPIGPGDHHLTPPSRMTLAFCQGKLPAYLDCEFNMIDVRDIATGMRAAMQVGRPGVRYLLGGANLRLIEWLTIVGPSGRQESAALGGSLSGRAARGVRQRVGGRSSHRPDAAGHGHRREADPLQHAFRGGEEPPGSRPDHRAAWRNPRGMPLPGFARRTGSRVFLGDGGSVPAVTVVERQVSQRIYDRPRPVPLSLAGRQRRRPGLSAGRRGQRGRARRAGARDESPFRRAPVRAGDHDADPAGARSGGLAAGPPARGGVVGAPSGRAHPAAVRAAGSRPG